MNTDKYWYILAIAENRSFSKAADELYLSQPYLSKIVSQTESELGVKIFDRSASPLSLTEAGEHYIRYIRTILEEEKKMLLSLEEIKHREERGNIWIGMGVSRATYLLPILLRNLQEKYPNVVLHVIEEASNPALVKQVENGKLDLAIYTSPEIPKQMDFTILYQEKLLLVMSKKLSISQKFRNRSTISIEEFLKMNDQTFIVLSELHGMGVWARDLFELYHFSPKYLHGTQNLDTAHRLAASGSGLTFIPEPWKNLITLEEEPLYLTIGEPPLKRNIVMIYKKGKKLSPIEQLLCDVSSQKLLP